jgi:PAS domain S-box-containing protein
LATAAHTIARIPAQDAAALLDTLDALRVALTIFDAQGRLLHANAHLNYLLRGLPAAQALVGRSYADLIRLEISGGQIAEYALAGGHDAFVAQRLSQLRPGNYAPLDVPLSDHRVMELKARHTADGHVVILWSDVTAARAQMARLEEAVRLSADAFALFDHEDRLLMGNDLYGQLVGAKLEELIGTPFPDIAARVAFNGRLALDEPPEIWLERRLKGHRQRAAHATLRTNDGKSYLVRDRATPDGGRAMVFTDITDKVRAETALMEQQGALADSLEQAKRQSSYLADLTRQLDQDSAKVASAKTTLLRTMGHELKTPLNAILGFSDLMGTLADNLTPDQVREYAGLVHQGGTNLLKMINQIMDLTKISAGRYDLRRGAVDAGGTLWLTRDVFMAKAQARGVAINADQCPVGLMVHADEGVFTAMMHSLVDNAVTFTAPGCTVTLSATASEAGIIATVADDGPGVSPDDLARIQEPFEHGGRKEAAEHAAGAGLGLTVVKAFAELHGGRLELDSRPGAGFRARVILPPAPPPTAA